MAGWPSQQFLGDEDIGHANGDRAHGSVENQDTDAGQGVAQAAVTTKFAIFQSDHFQFPSREDEGGGLRVSSGLRISLGLSIPRAMEKDQLSRDGLCFPV